MSNYVSIQISDSVKQAIMTDLIEPGYRENIKQNLLLKKHYANAGLVFEMLSKIFIGLSSITSFSAGIYQYKLLAFLAGAGSVVSLVFLQFSSYAFKEGKVISDELNKILEKLHIEPMPDPVAASTENVHTDSNSQ